MTRVWLGTAGWSYFPDWVGSFYPVGTSPSDALARYVEAFRFVEIDSTFYAAPSTATIARWASLIPTGFRVSCKVPKELVQDTDLHVPEVPFRHFTGGLLEALGDRMATFVVQMPPGFTRTPSNESSLRSFLRAWSDRVPLAIELRHVSWHVAAVDVVLRAFDVTWVSNDLHDVPDLDRAAHDTSKRAAYLRLIGRHDGLSKDRVQRPQADGRAFWTRHISTLAERGVRDTFVVVNNHYEGHAPATLRSLAAELRTLDNVEVVESPGWPDGQVSLF